MKPTPPTLYVTFHGSTIGATFDAIDKAKRYPGPRMLECAEKRIMCYLPAEPFADLLNEWQSRLEDIEGEGPRMELEAAISDLTDLLTKARYLEKP